MAEPLPVYPLTVDDYHAMAEAGILGEDARVELIDGQLVAKMPIGPGHIHVVNILNELAIKRASDVVEVSIQNPVRLTRHTEPEPDVVLLKKDRDVTRVPHAPDVLLLVEVAESSLSFDRKVKLPRYAAAGIPEVWIVNLSERRLECYRGASGHKYEIALVLDAHESVEAQRIPKLGALSVAEILGG
jgi:Uma2 family endonuclease